MSFLTFCALWLMPGWRDILRRRRARADRAACRTRRCGADMLAKAETSPLAPPRRLRRATSSATCSRAANERCRDRKVGRHRRRAGRRTRSTTLVDIVRRRRPADRAVAARPATTTTPTGRSRRALWDEPDVLLGGSDAGAHLDRMFGSTYPTRFLADSLRGRQLVLARAGGAAHDRHPGPAVRAPRPRPPRARAATPTSSCSTRARSTPAGRTPSTCRVEQAPARRSDRRHACCERHRGHPRRHADGRPPRHGAALRPQHLRTRPQMGMNGSDRSLRALGWARG